MCHNRKLSSLHVIINFMISPEFDFQPNSWIGHNGRVVEITRICRFINLYFSFQGKYFYSKTEDVVYTILDLSLDHVIGY